MRWRAWVIARNLRPPSIDERASCPRVVLEDARNAAGSTFLRDFGDSGTGSVVDGGGQRRAELGQRRLQPREVRLLAADDVLVGVVEVVVADEARAGFVALEQRQSLGGELGQESAAARPASSSGFCFSLQVMQTRVQGIAFSRASAIGSPQSRHTP